MDGCSGEPGEQLSGVFRQRKEIDCRRGEKRADAGEFGAAMTVGQKAAEANPLEAIGKRMQQEAADEFLGRDGHGAGPLGMTVVFPLKGDLAIGKREQPFVGKGDPMGVAAKVLQDLLRSAKGRLGVDDPVFVAKRSEVGTESARLAQRFLFPEELQLASLEKLLQGIQETVAEPGREDVDGEKETRTAGDPAIVIRAETAPGNDVVDVRMEEQVLTPGMQDAEETGVSAKMPCVATDGGEHIHADPEQQIVKQALIVKDQCVEFGGNGEDHMEVFDGQQLLQPLIEPAGARQ